jgi:hypothetical protein
MKTRYGLYISALNKITQGLVLHMYHFDQNVKQFVRLMCHTISIL